MKTRLFKLIAAMALLFTAIPMHSQNYLKIWFKDGHTERHFMHLVQNISTTKYDLEGNLHSDYQMQQIVMPDTTYSYYIADIDSMTFRKVDDQKVISDIKTAATVVESLLQQRDVTEMESCLNEIMALDGVEDAYVEESNLIVDIVDWGSLCYHLSHDSETDQPDLANISKGIKRTSGQRVWPIKCNNSVKVALLNQQSNDLYRKQYLGMQELQEEFKTMGFDAHYIPSEDLTVDFFLDDVFQYDIVYLNTHGIYTKKKHWFMTGEVLSIGQLPAEAEPGLLYQIFIGPTKKDVDIDGIIYSHAASEGRERIIDGKSKTDTVKVNVYYKTISEDVIAKSKSHFEQGHNTIFYNAACQSMKKNDSMAKKYTEGKHADVYFGYDDDSNTTKDLLAAKYIFEYMLNGYSLEAAMNRLKEEHNIPDPKYEHQNEDLIDQYNYITKDGKITREWIAHLKELDSSDYTKLFIVKTSTEESQKQKIYEEYNSHRSVTLHSVTSIADKEAKSNLKCGFRYGLDPTLLISYKEKFCDNLEYIENENGNVSFSCPISDIQPGQIIFYRAFTYDGFKYNYGDIKFFTVPTPVDIPAEAKDLGLPSGTKWASYNVGATAPEEYGEYFAWGELKEKDVFNESNYQFCKNGIYSNLGDDIGGTEYDVARERWGGEWMMPNKQMMQELYEYCTTKWTTQNDVYGTLFTGPNGESIFLPAAGYRKDGQQMQAGVWGDYWASTASEANTYSAYELYFKDGLINCDYVYNDNPTYRRNGHTVRPVIPGLQLTSNGPLSILMGDSETVGVRYGSGSYRYEVDKEGIVSVEITGSTITIHALSGGDAVVTVIDDKGGKATISVAVKAIPEAKDLGLPSGTKWASFNIGANRPEEYGEYFAWGEFGVKDIYNASTYEYCKNGMYTNIGKDIRGTEYDTAREKWGGEWMMPSTTQFNELIANCTSEWTTINGVKGRKFTSKINGEYIFFPAAGYYGSSVSNAGSNGYYWSGNIDSDNAEKATNLSVKSGTPGFASNTRFYGFSVRPVISGLELSATGTLSMFEGNNRTVTIKSGSGSYQPDVDKEGIVSVSIIGTTITINALKIGDVVFTVTDTKGGQKANIKINVRAVPKAIDLGLPSGTKWANVNVGANSPEEFGDYYAWGETGTKSVYTTSTYKHYKSSSYVDIGYDIRGSEYDAAQAKWGDKWKMPSSTQINELIANCTSEWTTVNGVNGLKFISKINGDSIFLPAVGYCESGVSSSGTSGYYWACDKVTDKNNGYNLVVKSSGPSLNAYSRYYGFAVRPVIRESDDDPRMDEVIPDNIRDKFKDHMPIYSGANPPNIEGSYLLEPYTVVFCEDGNWEPGHVIESYKIKFYNQSSTDNTIDMIDYIAGNTSSYSKGTGAFISGDGTHFTAYFSTEGMSQNIRTIKSIVISGTKTENGIENLYYGFVMVDKGSDPDHKLMDVGVFRSFKDGDGLSKPTTWEFESNARQMNPEDMPESETMEDGSGRREVESTKKTTYSDGRISE